jgi:DMSO/TMAO reductase YedYZ molybdopterin-dependent catalytic subunit
MLYIRWVMAVILTALSILQGGSGIINPKPSDAADTVSQPTEALYRPGEMREYRGVKLDPAIGAKDNSVLGVQHVGIACYRLRIDGAVQNPLAMRYEDVLKLDPVDRLARLECIDGWSKMILWRGVLLEDLFDMAGVKPEAVSVIFHAADGYTAVLKLDYIQKNRIVLAYQANGLALPPVRGYPFMLLAEGKLGFKWERWVERIELSADPDAKGIGDGVGYD